MQDPPRPDTWRGADYAQHSSLQEAMAAQALDLLDLNGDEQVLDIGCGDGRISARIAAQRVPLGSVHGTDASADMIAFAQRQHGEVPNLQFATIDARQLPFDASFDAVVSFNALHWLPDLMPALRGLRAALRPAGRAWIRLVTEGPVISLEAVAEQVRHEAAWAPLFMGFADPYLRLGPEQVATLASSVGLRVSSLRTQLAEWDFGSRAALFGFCNAGFGAWTHRLPPDRRDEFVGTVLERYLATRDGVAPTMFRYYQTDMALAMC